MVARRPLSELHRDLQQEKRKSFGHRDKLMLRLESRKQPVYLWTERRQGDKERMDMKVISGQRESEGGHAVLCKPGVADIIKCHVS